MKIINKESSKKISLGFLTKTTPTPPSSPASDSQCALLYLYVAGGEENAFHGDKSSIILLLEVICQNYFDQYQTLGKMSLSVGPPS